MKSYTLNWKYFRNNYRKKGSMETQKNITQTNKLTHCFNFKRPTALHIKPKYKHGVFCVDCFYKYFQNNIKCSSHGFKHPTISFIHDPTLVHVFKIQVFGLCLGTLYTTGAHWISSDETSPVSSFGLGEGLPDSDHTVLFHSRPPPALLFLVAVQETAGYTEGPLSELHCCGRRC